MNASLIRSELTRLLSRRRLLLLLAILLGLAIQDAPRDWIHWQAPGLFGALSYQHGNRFIYPILAAAVSADALAADLKAGYTGLVLSRRIDRREYLLSKAAAMFLAAALVAVIYNLFKLAVAAVLLPWEDALVYRGQVEVYLDGRFETYATIPGPIPELFITHPVLNDVLLVTMQAIGTGALATMGLIPAALGAGTYVAVGTPILWYLLMLYFGEYGVEFLSPDHYLNVWFSYRLMPPIAPKVALWLLYWAGTVAASVSLSLVVAEKRELGARGRA